MCRRVSLCPGSFSPRHHISTILITKKGAEQSFLSRGIFLLPSLAVKIESFVKNSFFHRLKSPRRDFTYDEWNEKFIDHAINPFPTSVKKKNFLAFVMQTHAFLCFFFDNVNY